MKVLVSACVYGNQVRWNGTHKLDSDLTQWAEDVGIVLVPVCPEDELFGTPRKPIRLEQIGGTEIVVGHMGSKDVYKKLMDKSFEIYSKHKDAVGFIGIAGSPSCGISVGVKNRGSTMKAPMHLQASMPTTEVSSLRSNANRESFLKRILKYKERINGQLCLYKC